MGGTSKSTQSQTQQLNPYDPAAPALNGLLGGISGMTNGVGINGAQQGAINTLTQNGQAGDPNAAGVNRAVGGLLNGGGATANNGAISGNLANYQGLLQNTAAGGNIGANSALRPQLDTIASDVTNQVNGQFAAAGRDGSPGNSMALARGIAAGEAPVIASQYNTDVANQLGAANSLYGAGNTTYGMLNANNAQGNANIQAGIGADPAAWQAQNAGANGVLNAQANQFGIPASQYQTLLGMISPVAAQFGQQTGTANGSQTMSGAQQFGMIANGIGSLMPKANFNFGG